MSRKNNTNTRNKGINGARNNSRPNNSRSKSCNNRSRNSRNGEPYYNDPSKEDRRDPASNDPSWYGSDPAILRDSASINYSIPTGVPLREIKLSKDGAPEAIPGLLALYTRSGIGYSADSSSPINVAANSIYSFVRHANSGHSNYDAPDLMIYLIAMSQVYSYINFLTRAYMLSTLYGQKNRYLPDALMKSMNIDADDVRTNGAQFRYGINVLVNKAASFAVPNNMPYFSREAFLYSGIYTEGTSLKDQLYIINPSAFLKFSLDENTSAGCLDYKVYRNTTANKYTVKELLDFGNDLLAPLLASEDMGIMSGDILKAYGQDQLIKLASVPETGVIIPQFNITVLEQIKNARVIGRPNFKVDGCTHVVEQKSSNLSPYLKSVPHLEDGYIGATNADAAYTIFSNPIPLTTTTADPGVDVTIENSRFATPIVGNRGPGYELYYASDYVVEACIYTLVALKTGDLAYSMDDLKMIEIISPDVASGIPTDLVRYTKLTSRGSNFDFLPLRYDVLQYTLPEQSEQSWEAHIHGDFDNFALVDNDTMIRMNEAALLNLLHVDTIAKIG